VAERGRERVNEMRQNATARVGAATEQLAGPARAVEQQLNRAADRSPYAVPATIAGTGALGALLLLLGRNRD